MRGCSSGRPQVFFDGRKNKGYSKVKAIDSEFDSEAHMIEEHVASSN